MTMLCDRICDGTRSMIPVQANKHDKAGKLMCKEMAEAYGEDPTI